MPERSVAPGGLGRRTKEATMTTKLVALVLLCLVTGSAMAQQPKVTSLMSKDLTENPGREVLMITVEHAPGWSSPIHLVGHSEGGISGRYYVQRLNGSRRVSRLVT